MRRLGLESRLKRITGCEKGGVCEGCGLSEEVRAWVLTCLHVLDVRTSSSWRCVWVCVRMLVVRGVCRLSLVRVCVYSPHVFDVHQLSDYTTRLYY